MMDQNSMLKRIAMAGVIAFVAAPLFAQGGDAAKGKELMNANGCFRCHRIGDTGARVGPNLSEIGDRRTPDRLQTSILDPDAEVLPENRFVLVTMKDGSTVRGRLLNHDGLSVQFLDTHENLRSILISDMKGYTIQTKGLMLSFKGKLTDDQVQDIVAYLSSLKASE